MNEYERPFSGGAGVYWLYDSAGQLLYIGVGWEPSYRWRRHAKKKDWWPQVDPTRTKLEWFRVYADALDRETAAIKADKPLHNMTHSTTRAHWAAGSPRKPRVACARSTAHPPLRMTNVVTLGVQVARAKLRDVVDDALVRGIVTVVERHGQPVAAVIPYEWVAQLPEHLRPNVDHGDSTSSR